MVCCLIQEGKKKLTKGEFLHVFFRIKFIFYQKQCMSVTITCSPMNHQFKRCKLGII